MAEDTRLELSEEQEADTGFGNIQHLNSNESNNIKINIQQPTARIETQTEDLVSDDYENDIPQDTLQVPNRTYSGSQEEQSDETQDDENNTVGGEKSENVDQDTQNDTEDEEEKRIEEENRLIDELKREMHNAVKSGDVFRLEELLNNPHADIKMTLYNENLLVTALKAGEEFMSEYLIDNDVDYNFQLAYLDLKEEDGRKKMEWYKVSCRQLAFDRDMLGIVELIDLKNNDLFDFVNPACRVPKIWQPKPIDTEDASENGENEEDKQTTSFETGNDIKAEDTEHAKTSMKPAKSLSVLSDVDSGLHSIGKSQPKKQTLSENNIEQSGAVHNTSQQCLTPDEGYETTSPLLSTCTSPLGKRNKLRSRKICFNAPTKSTILKYKWTSNNHSTINKSLPNVFQPSRVVAPGSYHCESKLWHVVNNDTEECKKPDTLPEMCAPVRTQSPWRNDVTSPLNAFSSKVNVKHPNDMTSRQHLPDYSTGREIKQSSLKRSARPNVVKSLSYDWTGKFVVKKEQSHLPGYHSAASRSTGSSVSSRRVLRSGTKIHFRPLTM